MNKNNNKNSGIIPITNVNLGKAPGKDTKKFYYVTSTPQLGEYYLKENKKGAELFKEIQRQKSEREKGPEVYAAKDKADAMKRAKRDQEDFKIVVVGELEHDKELSRMEITQGMEMGANNRYQAKRKEMKRKQQEMEDKRSRTWFKNPFKNKRDGR